MVLFVNCFCSFSLSNLFNSYQSLRCIQLSLGDRVATFLGKSLPPLLAIFSFCG